MSERKRAIEAYMRQAHDETWPVLRALTAEDETRPVYEGEGVWTVRDLVVHLADAEAGLLGQVQRLMAGKPTVPENFDLDRWNRSAVRRGRERSLDDLRAQILRAHSEAIETLQATEDQALDLEGRHASGRMLSAEGFFRRIADHRREHTSDLRKALPETGPVGSE